MQKSHTNKVARERPWFLFLEGHYRNFAEVDAQRNQLPLSILYSVIITIEDPDKTAAVYDSTIQSLMAHAFEVKDLSLDSHLNSNSF